MTDAPSASSILELSDVDVMVEWLRDYERSPTIDIASEQLRLEHYARSLLETLTANSRAKIVRRDATEKMFKAALEVHGEFIDDGVSFTDWPYMFDAAPPYTGE